MKKELIVILIFLVIISITGVGLAAAKPTQIPTPPPIDKGLIADLQAQIATLTAEKAVLQGQVTQLTAEKATLTAEKAVLQGQVTQLTTDLATCNTELGGCIQVLETPVLISPNDGQMNVGLPLRVEWGPVNNADSYIVDVRYYSPDTPDNCVCSEQWCDPSATWNHPTENTFFAFPSWGFLDPMAWRVMAVGSGNYVDSQWSEWRLACVNGCTEPLPPNPPV